METNQASARYEADTLIKVVAKYVARTADLPFEGSLRLPYDLRQKSRQRVRLSSGREAGIFLPRGSTLKSGDLLVTENGSLIKVEAAVEQVSVATIDDPLLLARIAYHLGNRHVAVQILADRLIYLHDHVLDDMVRGLGGIVTVTERAFEPEEGAYHDGGHDHSHAF